MLEEPSDMVQWAQSDEVLQLAAPAVRWLSTGWDGGFEEAPVAYNITVPDGWDRTDLTTYIAQRTTTAGFDRSGPALLTGVSMAHARAATLESVTAVATVGLSNPADLPVVADGGTVSDYPIGTVNLIVHTTRSLTTAGQANLVSLIAETKATTLLKLAGVPGTTSDAIIVGSQQTGEQAQFTGSATLVGNATRICVRDAIQASFQARYAETTPPNSSATAEHGVRPEQSATVFQPP